MKCDICRKNLAQSGTIVRFTSELPEQRIRSLLLVHKGCDTHPWPCSGYGHIDIRAMDKYYLSRICDRVVVDAQRDKLREAWLMWGYYGPTAGEEFGDGYSVDVVPVVRDEELPF